MLKRLEENYVKVVGALRFFADYCYFQKMLDMDFILTIHFIRNLMTERIMRMIYHPLNKIPFSDLNE